MWYYMYLYLYIISTGSGEQTEHSGAKFPILLRVPFEPFSISIEIARIACRCQAKACWALAQLGTAELRTAAKDTCARAPFWGFGKKGSAVKGAGRVSIKDQHLTERRSAPGASILTAQ